MKQKDWALILVIVFISGIFSYFIANIFVSSPTKKPIQVEVVEKISSDFVKPDSKYFNSQSVDPTQLIQIGDSSNQKPFQ